MRVLHIGKYFPPFAGGMENFLADLSRETVSQGVECAVLVHDHSNGELAPEELIDGCQVFRVRSYGQILFAPVCPGFLAAFKSVLASFQPDVIHLHLPNTSVFFLLLVPAAKKIPWVIHWHSDVVFPAGRPLLYLAYQLYQPFERALLKRSRAIIATSPNYLQSSQVLQRYRDKCQVIPLALSAARLPVLNDSLHQKAAKMWNTGSGSEQPLKILCIGRLTHYKGHELLIDALGKINPMTHHVSALIVGDGELKEQLETQIETCGLLARVKLLGHQSDLILQALLANCDVLCMPSTLRTEAFGLVLLEAMYHGKPAIVSQIEGSGMTWVISDNENGWYVAAGDAQALADKLRQLAEHPEQIAAASIVAREKFENTFSMSHCAQQVIELYKLMQDSNHL